MTSQEFVQWLRGFTEGVHEFNVTPKQWDLLKERLSEVNDNKLTSSASASIAYRYPNGTTVSYTGGTTDSWNIKNKDLLHD